MPILDPADVEFWQTVILASVPGIIALVAPLVIAWWNNRRQSEADGVNNTFSRRASDREDASLYLKFKNEIEQMEKRNDEKILDIEHKHDEKIANIGEVHRAEMLALASQYTKEINELKGQMARDRATVDFLLEHVDPRIAKVARQIQSGELKRDDPNEGK